MSSPTLEIKRKSRDLIKEFGYSEREFIAEAIRDKLMELRKLQFFSISEKIRKGLKKKGIKPEDILKEIKS